MDLPLIGCKEEELIYVSTEKIDFTIIGKPCHPKAEALNKSCEVSYLSIKCTDDFSADIIFLPQENVNDSINKKEVKYKTIPLFFENQNYQLIIENKEDHNIFFWHENSIIKERIKEIGRSKKILSGVLNFGNEIGLSELKVIVDGVLYFTICVEVFPSKVNYTEDYVAILNDVNSEIYNLSFDFFKKTFLWANIKENVGNSPTEFFSIIQIIFDRLIIACDTILKHPHHILKRERDIVPFHKLRKSNADTIKWIQKHPQNVIRRGKDYLPLKALETKKFICFDTFENRFAKYILKVIVKKLENIKTKYMKLDRKTNGYIIERIDLMHKEIIRRLEFSFLKEVGDLYTLNSYSLVLNMAIGYKDLYKYYLMILKGLSLNGEIFKISIKDLSILYEYWCFIKLNSLLKSKYNLVRQDLIQVDYSGIFVTLCKGKKASVTYINPKNGEKFTISYNPVIHKNPTISQRPDNILSIQKNKSNIKYEYIFDAKYRINAALEGTKYKDTYGWPGPEEEDINTMHRYRDAIVQYSDKKNNFEKNMFGAYVLFPFNDIEQYKMHKFYESIEKVNIGGLPFLPSATLLVEELLEEIIEETPETSFERTVLQKGTYDYINNIDLTSRDVLVGTLSSVEQFEVCLNDKFYHIPCSEIAENRLPLRYVAIYQSNNKFKNEAGIKYYGKIILAEKLRRSEIKELKSNKNGENLYYKFHIKEWKELNNPIKPKEIRIRSRIYTNLFLLLNAEYVTELCIKSREEYRLYMELKRLANDAKINISTDQQDEIFSNIEFENAQICVEDGLIKVRKNEKYKEVSIQNFKSMPRKIVLWIKHFLDK